MMTSSNLNWFIFSFLGALWFFATSVGVYAQAGANDPTFNTYDDGTFSDGINGNVSALTVQLDGKIIAGGSFTEVNGASHSRIVRLNQDGSCDTTFSTGVGFTQSVRALVIQTDGKILVGGSFNTFNGVPSGRIIRLNANGAVDMGFNVGIGFSGTVYAIEILPNGKILVGGNFNTFNGTDCNHIARLNADGTFDQTFNSDNGFNASVYDMALQPDGKVIVAGDFTEFNGISRERIARLYDDGGLDEGFFLEGGFNDNVVTLALQQDGKVLAGGLFSTNGYHISRLDTNGVLDIGFASTSGFNSSVSGLAVQPDGKIVVVGGFSSYNGVSRNKIARLMNDGALDTVFDPGFGFGYSSVQAMALLPDGKVIAGGGFETFNGRVRNNIAQLNADCSLDQSFMPSVGIEGEIWSVGLQPDEKIIVTGSFSAFNGVAVNDVVRLHSDGTIDLGFDAGTGVEGGYGYVSCFLLQPDGKIVIGGSFNTFNGINRKDIVRLNSDGSVDGTFNPGNGFEGIVLAMARQPDGKIIVGGEFQSYNGIGRNGIARLNADGVLDMSFDPGSGYAGSNCECDFTSSKTHIRQLSLQSDGKIVLGGGFTYYNGVPINRIARLHPNGSLDLGYDIGSGLEGYECNPSNECTGDSRGAVQKLKMQPDGEAIFSGTPSSFDGFELNDNTFRLNSDGSLDPGFQVPTDSLGYSLLDIQPDGKILLEGRYFSPYPPYDIRMRIIRVHPDGSVDSEFDSGIGFNNFVYCSAIQSDGKIIVAGEFSRLNGIPRHRIARLLNGPVSVPEFESPASNIHIYHGLDAIHVVLGDGLEPDGTVSVMDMTGRLVHRQRITSHHTSVQLSPSPGIYIVQAETTGRTHRSKVFIP